MADTGIIQLGGDAIPEEALVVRYRAVEAISRPYEVRIEFSVPLAVAFKPKDCLRTNALLELVDEHGGQRFFHGLVAGIEYLHFTGTHHHFELLMRPALAALAHRENCKIWQDIDVHDVVLDVFKEAGIEDVEFQLAQMHEPRPYTVQYRESELDFIQRLFEDEALFYFFRHTPDGHKLIIADDPSFFVPSDDAPAVAFAMSQGIGGQPLTHFNRTRSLRTSVVQLRDYDFEKPQAPPEATLPAEAAAQLPFFDYPGKFSKAAVGELRATAQLRARRQDSDVGYGISRAIGLRCGVPFVVSGARQPWLNGEFVVTRLESWGEQSSDGADNEVVHNRFQAVPAGAPYLPARRAPRPTIHGIQTAVVTGASSESEAIHVDKYGRIKVRFFWDRINQQDDTASCWLRVVQLATGGTMMLPRIGWEMAIAFEDGDPDRPFSMGRIYNGEKVAPAALPAAKASGGLKSYSTPGGAGINEINLGDAGGAMGWTMNAQKDLNVIIENDKNETIAVDSSHDIKVNTQISVGSNETVAIGGNQTEAVGSVRCLTIGANQTIDVGGNETNNATHNMLETVAGDRDYGIGGTKTTISNTVMQTVKGNVSRDVGMGQLTASIASITEQVGGNYSEDVGAIKAELVRGLSTEQVGGNKNATSIAAELHVLRAKYDLEASGSVTYLVGAVHYQKIDGDFSVKGKLVTLLGATGDFKGGKGNLKLGGGPVVAKGSKIVADGKLLVKLGTSLKMG